jgi:hypothetical protein
MRSTLTQGKPFVIIKTWDLHWHRGSLLLLLRHEIYTDTGEPFCHPSTHIHNCSVFVCVYGHFLYFHDYVMTTSCSGGERLWHIADSIFIAIPRLLVVMGRNALTYSWQHFHDNTVTTSCNGRERLWYIADSIFMTIPCLLVVMGEKCFDI